MKRFALSVIALMVCAAFALYAGGKQESTGAQKTSFKIALSNSYIGNTARAEQVKIFEAYTKKLHQSGAISDSFSSSSGTDPQAQINEIRNMMAKGFDAIIVNAASPTALIPVLEEAMSRGIVIVCYDNLVDSDKVYAVKTDRVQFGKLQAQWVVDKMGGKGNLVLIRGIEGTGATREASQGWQAVLDKYPDVKVLAAGDGKWDDAATVTLLNNILSANKGQAVNGILNEGGNSNGVYAAFSQNGVDPKSVWWSGEMENSYWKHMKKDGVKGVSVGQPIYLVAAAVDLALDVLKGKTKEKTRIIPLPVADYTQVDAYYAPDLPDSFFVSWKDAQNTYGLSLQDVIPEGLK
jgi:ribose transport system substrate-binding protein